MVQCNICNNSIAREDKNNIHCVKCKIIFHGRCVNLTDKDTEALKIIKKTWVCSNCEQVKKQNTEPSPSEILAAVNRLDATVNEDIKNMKTALDKYGELSFELNERLTKIEKHLEGQAKKFEEILLENKALKSRVGELEVRLNNAEQGLLSRSLEIRGIPERPGETPAALVTSIGASLGIRLSVEDLDNVHRRRSRKDDSRPPPVIARFVRQSIRDDLITKRKVKRDFSTRDIGWQENDCHRIYLGEEMTRTNRHLYWLARQKRAAGKIKYTWFASGKVRCRKEDGHRVILIEQASDLDVFD